MKFFLTFIYIYLIFCLNLNANTVAAKCHVDENKSYSFILDQNEKSVTWVEENNQKLSVMVFPDVNKGGYLLIMGGANSKNEKFTFVINVVKSTFSATTNQGKSEKGNCGNKSIIEPIDPYAE
tara:strand:+ start:7160 stop:7528 length:369 start_codon:yes stop_codon:yes gene_type:complete